MQKKWIKFGKFFFRHILYKELMSKDQHLEICRGQIKRLQRELKLIYKENTALQEKLGKNNPQVSAVIFSCILYIHYKSGRLRLE